MKNGFFIFLLLLILPSSSSYADDSCRNVNLTIEKKWGRAAYKTTGAYTKWNSAFKQMPLYDQGATGICYAYAGVQLADYWRETRGIRVTQDIGMSSPIYAALLTRQSKDSRYYNRKDISGGGIEPTLLAMRDLGMCRQDVIQGVIDQYAKSKSIDQREFTEIIESLFVNFPGNPRRIQRLSSKQIWKKYIYGKFSFYSGRKIKNDGKIAKIFKLVAPYIDNGNIVDLMNDLFKICRDPRSIYIPSKNIPRPNHMVIRKQNMPAIKSFMRELLNRKNAQPIGIGYCSKFLTDNTYRGTRADPKYNGQMTIINSKTCGPHASIIIGKRNIKGKCHYLLRNTWGDECDYDWKCRYNAKKQAIGVWVPEDAFFANLTNINWLEKPEYLCLAKNRSSEQFFALEKPKAAIYERQTIDLFNNTRKLYVKVDPKKQNSIRFLYGKSSRSLYTAKEIPAKDFKGLANLKVKLNYKKKRLNFKMICLPNIGSRSKIQAKLRKKL